MERSPSGAWQLVKAHYLTVDTQKTALTIHTGSEGGFLRIYHQKVLALFLQMFHSRVKVSFRVKEETFTHECNTCKQATLAGVAAKH